MLCGGGNLAKERDFCQEYWLLGILIHPLLVARIEGKNVNCEMCRVLLTSARERKLLVRRYQGAVFSPKFSQGPRSWRLGVLALLAKLATFSLSFSLE